MKYLLTAASALVVCAAPAAAQGPGAPTDRYSSDLAAMSHVLGSAHYVRRLCSGRADQSWREQMRRFMDLEGPPGTPQRSAMVAEFNAGFREQEERFPSCTPQAQAYELQLKKDGARLANALAARYRD